MRRRRAGFTLAECMIALLFISIALFAYVSLHIRLIHSGLKLELRETYHARVGKQIGRKLFGEVPDRSVKLNNKPFDYFTGANITDAPPQPSQGAPFEIPQGVQYYEADEHWTDRNGEQTILVDTCKADREFQGW